MVETISRRYVALTETENAKLSRLITPEYLRSVLRNPDDDTSLIREITAATYPPLKADGVVSKGMIPKIENALKAVEKGVRSVTIRSSENLSNGIGTVIRNS